MRRFCVSERNEIALIDVHVCVLCAKCVCTYFIIMYVTQVHVYESDNLFSTSCLLALPTSEGDDCLAPVATATRPTQPGSHPHNALNNRRNDAALLNKIAVP